MTSRAMEKRTLEGQVAIITGGTRGIGLAIARALAEDGAAVALQYLSDHESARQAVGRLQQEVPGCRCLAAQGDVACSDQVQAVVQKVRASLGVITIAVHNAGWTQPQFVLDTTEADWDRMIAVHLKGAFNLARAVLPDMMERRGGVLVTISSVTGRAGFMGAGVHYCAAKAGLQGLTRALAHQLAPYGIRAVCVAPGLIDTPMIRWRTPELLRRHLEMVPLGRVGRVEEVAAAVRFVCSPAAAYITGEVVDVNGGLYMR